MKHNAKLLAGTLAATILATAAMAEDINVGILLPFSGVYSAIGNEIENGFNLGMEQFAGETSASFTFTVEDTEIRPPIGLAKARKLILQDEVDVIIGVVSSGVLGAVRDLIHNSGVPLIVATAGNNHATGKDCSPYIVRTSFSNAMMNRPMGTWMADQGVETVYALAPDYAAGHQMIEAFTEAFEAGGGEVLGTEYTPFGKTQDFGPYLVNAQASGADAFYVFYAGGEAIKFVKQYDSFGLSEDMPLYGMGLLTSPLYVAAEGPAADGIVAMLNYVPTIENDANAAFVDAFQAAYGKTPSEFAVYGYDAARALIEATASGASDRESIAAALRLTSFDGPRGLTAIDPITGNIAQPMYVFETVVTDGVATQNVLATLPVETDPVNGCTIGG